MTPPKSDGMDGHHGHEGVPEAPSSTNVPCVLLVDDDPQDARLLTIRLQEAFSRPASDGRTARVPFVVEHVTDLTAAADAISAGGVDLVLLDLGLRETQGLDTFRRVRSEFPATAVVVLTGLDDDEVALAAIHEGAHDYLVKDRATAAEVVRTLRFAFERQAAQATREREHRQRQALLDLGQLALRGVDTQPLLEAATRALADGLGVARTHVLQDPDGKGPLVFRAGVGWPAAPDGTLVAERGTGSWGGYTVETGEAVVVDDLSSETRFAPGSVLAHDPPVAGLTVPIPNGHRPWGLCGAFSDRRQAFTDSDVAFALQVATLVSEAVHRHTVEHDLRERVKELHALQRLTEAVARPDTTRPELLDLTARELVASMQFPGVTSARVELDGATVTWPEIVPDPVVRTLLVPVELHGERRGCLEVRYHADRQFIAEEQYLLDAATATLAVWLGRQEATDELVESRELLQTLLDTAPAGIVFVDANSTVTFANPAAHRLTGAEPDGLIGDGPEQLWARRSFEAGSAADELPPCQQVIASGEPLAGLRVDLGDGDDDTVIQVDAAPLQDPVGAVAGALLVLTDVTNEARAVEELRRSRAWLELLFEQVPGVIFTTDQDLEVTAVYGTHAEGYENTDVSAQLWALDRRDRQRILDAIRTAAEGTPASFEFESDGHHLHGSVRPLEVEGATSASTIGLITDVTAEHQREAELADRQARLDGLFQNALDAIVLADDDGRYLDANPAFEQLTGYSVDELRQMTVGELVAPVDPTKADILQEYTEFRGLGAKAAAATLRRKDGRLVEAEYRAVANIVPGVHLSVMHDVTARKRAERSLAASQAMFRDVAESLEEGVFRASYEPEPHLVFVNPAFEQLTGADLDAEPRLETALWDKIHEEDRHIIEGVMDDPAGQPGPSQFRFRRDDELVWLELRHIPVRDADGTVTGLQGTLTDVTRRRQEREALERAIANEQTAADRLRRVDEMKSTFLQAVSHELRTPLTSVYGMAVTLQRQDGRLSTDARARLLEVLARNAERIRDLLDDLWVVQQLMAADDPAVLERQSVDVSIAASSALDAVDLGDRAVDVELESVSLHLDGTKVRRIIGNLLQNVRKHTPDDAHVWVRVERADDGGALVCVEDDGPGVPPDVADEMFAPLIHGPRAADDPNPGLGVGLHLVERFAELHGGRAWYEDRPGGGAAFFVHLPGTAAPPDAAGT